MACACVLAIFRALFPPRHVGTAFRTPAHCVGPAITRPESHWRAAYLLLAGGVGLFLFHGKRLGAIVLVALTLVLALVPLVGWSPLGSPAVVGQEPTLGRVAALFAAVGAFTFGGGLTMIALMEEHVASSCKGLRRGSSSTVGRWPATRSPF